MSNIIDSIRLSGTTYQIQGSGGGITVDPTLDSGSTNPVANSAITTALGDKVNVVDNNASAYTFESKIGGVEYSYSEHFAGPLYIRYTGSTSSSGGFYAGSMLYYSSEWGWDSIGLDFNLSNGQITATTVSSVYFDIEIENGEATLTFKDGFYLRQYDYQNGFVALTKTAYESGQSADVIEDTVYDVFDKLNDKIDKVGDKAVIGNSINFSNGYLESNLHTNKTTLFSSVKIDSSTIKSSYDGLSVQFETLEVTDKILNVGSGSYGQLFSTSSYDTSLNEFTITFNPNCTQSNVYYFSVRIIDTSNAMYDVTFEYNSADISAVYTYLNTYCTVTDTLSTDYKLKVAAKEGYKIARLRNGNYMVGGVDNTNPNNYISNLVTTPSYVHDGQDVIDDIYDKLDDKQDQLVSGTNIKTINNQSLLGSGNIDIQGGSITVDSALSPTSENPVQNKAIYNKFDEVEQVTAAALNVINGKLDDKVNVVDNEVPDYNVTNEITYQGGYPSQTETASTWDAASMFTLRYNFVRSSDANFITTAAVIDPSNNIITGRVTTSETKIANPLPDYIDMSFDFDDSIYRFIAKEGYRIAHLDVYNDKWAVWGWIREERVETVFEGGQSADVIKDVIEPTLINKQDKLVAGRGLTITTGETADTVSFNLPISAGTGTNSIVEGEYTTASGYSSHAEGSSTKANGNSSHAEGLFTEASGYYSHAEGNHTTANGQSSHAEGLFTEANNNYEHASGRFNISNKANDSWGDSGNTLFSVGNGTTSSSRHNAFEVRQNGDIYISSGNTDIKLQDHLGGSSITVDTALDSGSTNPVENKAIYNKFDEVEQVTAAGLNVLNDKFGGLKLQQITQSAYDQLQTKDPSTLYVIVD